MKFTHLHTHSDYSLLDGLAKVDQLLNRARELKMDALALTDHGSMYAVIDFYKKAKTVGIKPIIGEEFYVAVNRMQDKQPHIDNKRNHLILLAKNEIGYKNLIKLTTKAHLQGYYYKPRIDKELLKQHTDGLIASSSCVSGEIPRLINAGNIEKAKQTALEFKQMFGPGNFYLEVGAHPNLKDQIRANEEIFKISKELDIPVIATNDIHYLKSDDADAQDVLLAIQTKNTVNDQERLSMKGEDFSMKSQEQMIEFFKDYPEAITNTQKVALQCNLELKLGEWIFPDFNIPDNKDPNQYLKENVFDGLKKLLNRDLTQEESSRLDYELNIIKTKGYATYFLVVADFVNWSRSHGIVATTRGSAAGSLASYALGITTVNPLDYGLPFERFLNPFRPSPPDIDMDFADNQRDQVIEYVKQKYGEDKVAQIATFGKMLARAAVRDVVRSLDMPYSFGDTLAKMIPPGKQGFPMTINRALNEVPELKQSYDTDVQTRKVIDYVKKLEGCARHASVHAAGVVISPKPLNEYVPLQRETGGEKIITQYEMRAIEDIGLLKMDFLGIRNLSILSNAVKIIKQTKNIDIDLNKIPLNDKKTYEFISRGDTMGLFQLGGAGMTRYLKELKPTVITDIMAMIALFRPGPMDNIPTYIRRKHNREPVTYLDPRLEKILDKTYGVVTYQDDVLLIAIELAGYDWNTVDKFRKAIGKKIPEEMAAQEKTFIEGCQKHGGLSLEKSKALWKLFNPFKGYGFNKAHAASYGIVAYQTAYLKANWPAEFMTAVLTAEAGDNEKIAAVVNECKNLKIEVMPPDINESQESFTYIDDTHIRFGLLTVKNLGENVIKAIIKERKNKGPFGSIEDLIERVESKDINKKSLESMAKCGALDKLAPREQILFNMENILEFSREIHRTKAAGQNSLFGLTPQVYSAKLNLMSAPPIADKEKLVWEKELLGLYISDHPYKEIEKQLKDYTCSLSSLNNSSVNQTMLVAGIINSIKKITTKNNQPMLFVTIEDMTGKIEVIVFPKVLEKDPTCWQMDAATIIKGKINDKDGTLKILADEARVFNGSKDDIKWLKKNKVNIQNNKQIANFPASSSLNYQTNKSITITISSPSQELFNKIKNTLAIFPKNNSLVYLEIKNGTGFKKLKTSFRMEISNKLIEELKRLVGQDMVKIV